MKKLLKISLVSMLVAMPMMAGAAPVAGEPVAGNADSPTATSAPKYALKGTGAGDEKAALASYVKGAYNAVIKGINNTQDEINTLNSGIETYSDAIGHLTDGKATQDGTVATIKSARTNESIATSSVQFNNVTPTSISATASGNVNLSVPVVDDWEGDTVAADPVQVTTSFSGLAVNNLTMSAPSSNTATLTKTGITGTVNVAEYLASMGFDFTTLIDVNGDSYGYLSADGSKSSNATGLSNGEWTATWNAYGTVKGTSMCSADWDGYGKGNTISGTPASVTNQSAKAGCWCKMTNFTDTDVNATPAASLWVFLFTPSSAENCAGWCAFNCVANVSYDYDFKSALFGSVQ